MNHIESVILVVEFQKTWTEEGSFFHFLIKNEYINREIYKNSKKLLNEARRNNIKIIQSPFIIDKNNIKSYKKIPFLPKILGQFKAGTWRAEYTDGIFKEGDYVVTGRTNFDNTINSNLTQILEELKVKTVYIMGFTTDHCVAETIDSLLKLGYIVILIKDATATFKHSTQFKMEKKYQSISVNQLIEVINSYKI